MKKRVLSPNQSSEVDLLEILELIDKANIVADRDDSSFEIIECISNDRKMTEVDMVGRFVEDEDMRSLEDKSCVAEESFLPFRQ